MASQHQHKSSTSTSAYDAFTTVDELVSKPVIGSDGASKWQDFRKDSGCITSNGSIISGVAPALPAKKVDRLGVVGSHHDGHGVSSLETLQNERQNEQNIRKEAGLANVGEGYTTFKRKHNQDEIALQKKNKAILDRIRPDKKKYFIESKTFDGWKHDYVFTTRTGRGTGYYWDGMDSVKDLKNGINTEVTDSQQEQQVAEEPSEKKKKKKKKKSKDKASYVPIIVEDTNNPLDQVTNAIRRRNEMMMQRPPGCTATAFQQHHQQTQQRLPTGWEQTIDTTTKKIYYFNRITNEQSWTIPTSTTSNNNNNNNNNNKPDTAAAANTVIKKEEEELPLPVGWEKSIDTKTNKSYYYCRQTGETSWTIPDSNESSTATTAAAAEPPSSTTTITSNGDNNNNNESKKENDNVASYDKHNNKEEEEEEEGTTTRTNNNEDWNVAIDPNTKKKYYYNSKTGETKWNL